MPTYLPYGKKPLSNKVEGEKPRQLRNKPASMRATNWGDTARDWMGMLQSDDPSGDAMGMINPMESPAALLAGWIKPGLRKGIAANKFAEIASEWSRKRKPEVKGAYKSLLGMADQYPNVTAHIRKFLVGDLGPTTKGSMNFPPKSVKEVKKKIASGYSFDDAVTELEKTYPSTIKLWREAQAGNMPEYMQTMTDPSYYPYEWKKNLAEWEKEKAASDAKVKDWAADLMTGPQGKVEINPDSYISNGGATFPETARHEYGHWALALKDDPAFTVKQKEFGYWLDPNEIRARAVAGKAPLTEAGRASTKRVTGSTYKKNDYMNRITNSIRKGMMESSEPQRQQWMKGLNSGDILLPKKYYDYLYNVEPGDYMQIQNWASGMF